MTVTNRPDSDLFSETADAVAGGEDVAPLAGPATVAALARLLTDWRRLARANRALAGELGRIAVGRSAVAPAAGDWRFADPTWQENAAFHRTMQIYLAWSRAVMALAEETGLPWRSEERARFALNVLTSAAAPTNLLLTNPAAMKRLYETGGASVVRGTRTMIRDWRSNGSLPRQFDATKLHVGVDLAVTAGAVVYRDERMEVIQYRPTTPQVHASPVVVIPPQVNKYYFLDLAPGRSFVEYAVSRGLQVFMISWCNPTPQCSAWGLDDYAGSVLTALDVARSITGADQGNVIGFCAGGITCASALNHLATTGTDPVASATFAVTLLDFDVPAMLGMLASPTLLRLATSASRRAGVLPGRSLGKVFTWFRPNDLVWNYVVNNYLLGNDPPVFDILAWNGDTTNLPATLHRQFLEIFGNNLLCHAGSLRVLDTPVDLSQITVDTYVTGAATDHLTPWKGCYRTTAMVGGSSTFVLSNGGHIQALVNPPGNPKSFHIVGDDPGPDPDTWLQGAQRHPGSWWEHWSEWVAHRSGPLHPAPRRLGTRAYPPIADAPGTYIHIRS